MTVIVVGSNVGGMCHTPAKSWRRVDRPFYGEDLVGVARWWAPQNRVGRPPNILTSRTNSRTFPIQMEVNVKKSERLEIRVTPNDKQWLEKEALLQDGTVSDVIRAAIVERQRQGVRSLEEAYRKLGLAPLDEWRESHEFGKGRTTSICAQAAIGVLHGEKALMVATTYEGCNRMSELVIKLANRLGATNPEEMVGSATASVMCINPHLWAGSIGRVYADHWIDSSVME